MNKLKALIIAIGLLVTSAVTMGAGFNPGTYPFVYRTGSTPGATPSSGSGVIFANTSALVNCQFYNSGAATEYFAVYNSATVAGQSGANIICGTSCAATSFCSCSGPQPSGPAVNGAIVAGSGLSWGDSKAFPGPTASPDLQAMAICTYLVAQ